MHGLGSLWLTLISLLGSDSWQTRESVTHFLATTSSGQVLSHYQTTADLDPEIRRRIEWIVADWRHCRLTQCCAEAETHLRELRYAAWPWIDSLPADYPDRQEIIAAYLGAAVQAEHESRGPDWPAYRQATKLYVEDLLRGGRLTGEIRELLGQLVEGDRRQCKANVGYTWRGPGRP